MKIRGHSAFFLSSSASFNELPVDNGTEIAFAGRSNSGKSSVLNMLMGRKSLAKTSSEPGKTRLINLYSLGKENNKRLADLPGYGYAKVNWNEKKRWGKELTLYLTQRSSLKGVIIVMDMRHPLTELDRLMIDFCLKIDKPIHILFNKSDKLARHQRIVMMDTMKKELKSIAPGTGFSSFSTLNREGLPELRKVMNQWLTETETEIAHETFHILG